MYSPQILNASFYGRSLSCSCGPSFPLLSTYQLLQIYAPQSHLLALLLLDLSHPPLTRDSKLIGKIGVLDMMLPDWKTLDRFRLWSIRNW